MLLPSSRPFNHEYEIIEGLKAKTVGFTILLAILGFLFTTALDIDSRFLNLVAVIFIPIWAGARIQTLLTGKYPYEGLEKEIVNIKGKKSVETVDINQKISLEPINGVLFTANGQEVYAFEVDSRIDPKMLSSIYAALLLELGHGHSISFLRDTSADKELTHLLTSRLLIAFELDPIDTNIELIKRSIDNILQNNARKLNLEELTSFYKRAFDKNRASFEWEAKKGFFLSPISLLREEALLHFGDIENRALCLSLADLPEHVGEGFQTILNLLQSLPSTLHINYMPLKNPNILGRYIEKRLIEKRSGQEMKAVNEQRRTHLIMSLTCLVHGTKDQLNQFMQDLQRAFSTMPSTERFGLARDNAILKSVLTSILPGGQYGLPGRRRFRILDLDEAVSYLPRPYDTGANNALLQMRTAHNSKFNLSYSADYPLYIWGGMGKGKTAFMSDMLIAHIDATYQDEKKNTFVLTAGDGYHFLLDEHADLSMIFAQNSGHWDPLTFHPLKAFFAFGERGLEEASSWIADMGGIEDPNLKLELTSTLKELKKSNKYKMSDFYADYEKTLYEKWPESQTAPDHYSRSILSKIRNYCDLSGSLYGAVFEPESTDDIAFENVKTFYVTKEKAQPEESEILSTFYSLANHIFYAWDAHSERPLLIAIDELGHLLKSKAIKAKDLDTYASQGRKQAKYIVVGSQKLSDISQVSENLLDSFQHFLFADSADASLLKRVLRAPSEERSHQKVTLFERSLDQINSLRLRKGLYSWGYIDANQKISVLIHDLDPEVLWLIASHKPARDLKAKIRNDFNLTHREAAKMMALYGPAKVPQEESDFPSKEVLGHIYDRILKHK